MTRRKTLTDHGVKQLKPRAKRYAHPDPELRNHYILVHPTDFKTFAVAARDPTKPKGKNQVWARIGEADKYKIEDARELARAAIKRIQAGRDPFEPAPEKPDSFKAVAESYIKLHVVEKGLRSKPEIERILSKYITPRWAGRDFVDIKKSDVAKLLDSIVAGSGKRQADYALAVIRAMMRWYAERHDGYQCLITGKMRRTDPKTRKRERFLDDSELRIIWNVAETNGAFGAIVRLALLSAQRREKIAALRWTDLSVDGLWSIPSEQREKGNAGALMLPEMALAIIREQPRIGAYIFAGRGDGHFNGFSPCKRRFDEKVMDALRQKAVANGDDPGKVAALPRWTVHDLRRSSRSLMARAGIRPDIAERLLGHRQNELIETYDRHSYDAEKKAALEKLGALIAVIVDPPAGNVVVLKS